MLNLLEIIKLKLGNDTYKFIIENIVRKEVYMNDLFEYKVESTIKNE